MKKTYKILGAILFVGMIGCGIYWHQTATIIWNGFKITNEGIIIDFPNEKEVSVPSHVLGRRVVAFSSAEGEGKESDDKPKIERIIFNNNDQLKTIYIFESMPNLQEIKLDEAKKITKLGLYTNYNRLKQLDVSKNTELRELYIGGVQIDTIDISHNIKLERFDCSDSDFKTLDVTNNINLDSLACGANELESLDVSKNINLKGLSCGSNKLKTLDVSKNIKLDTLMCEDNQLTELDLSKNTLLTFLDCKSNNIKSIDTKNNTKLENIYIDVNEK